MKNEIRLKLIEQFPNCIAPSINGIERTNMYDTYKRLIYEGSEVWACAYSLYSKTQKPQLGIIKYINSRWKFYPYRKDKVTRKSDGVLIERRVLSRTKTESIEIYNWLVNLYLKELENMIKKVKNDIIE